MRRVAYAACLALPLFLGVAAVGSAGNAVAQQGFFAQKYDDARKVFGLTKEQAAIDYTERAPLVVPPTYTLPPPGADVDAPVVNDPDTVARRRALIDSRRPVPPSDPGASATGRSARTYLIDPPSGMRDPAVIAAGIETDKSAATTATATKTRRHVVSKRTPAPPESQ